MNSEAGTVHDNELLFYILLSKTKTDCQCSDDFQTVTQMFWFIVGYRTVSLPRINSFHAWWSSFLDLKITMTHLIKWHEHDSAWWMIFLGGSGEGQSGFQCAGRSHGRKNNEIIKTKLTNKFSSFLPSCFKVVMGAEKKVGRFPTNQIPGSKMLEKQTSMGVSRSSCSFLPPAPRHLKKNIRRLWNTPKNYSLQHQPFRTVCFPEDLVKRNLRCVFRWSLLKLIILMKGRWLWDVSTFPWLLPSSPTFVIVCVGLIRLSLLAAHYEVPENSLLLPAVGLRLPSTDAVKGSWYKGLDFFSP